MRRLWIVAILFLFSMSMLNPLTTGNLQESQPESKITPSQLLNIERDWTANIIVVNYDQSLIDEAILLTGMPTVRSYATTTVFITHNIEYNVYYADQNYVDDLSQVVTDNSVNGSETGTYLDETALLYHRDNLEDPQRVFYPRAGRVIDGYAVEEWLEDNPYVTPPSLGYTLYLVNFSSLDTAGHGLEHWYDYHPSDPDTGENQDWFRLEWDNALNPNVTMDHASFGGRFNTFVVDPSAHQWYLKWCRIWWATDIVTEYDFWTQDLEDKVASLDLSNPTDVDALNVYLQECIWDPINQLFFPYQHQPAKYVQSGLLRALVICMDVANGTSVDSLRWVTDAEMQKAHLEELYPFISWDVQVDFIDIDQHPMWNTTFWNHATIDPDNMTIVDGYGMFYDIRNNLKPLYVDGDDPNINVFGVVFIKKQMEMHIDGRTYTGLGGGGQTVIWKAWDRYYRTDGVTPKDGVSGVQLHETMHAIGFGHTWRHEHYSSDFSFGPMGYFTFHNGTASYDKNWVQETYLDQMHAILWDEFTTAQAGLGLDERPETYIAEQKALALFEDANDLYEVMNWVECFNVLSEAQEWIDRLTWSTLDDTPPVISLWGANPNISTAGFIVQAQVVDDLSGIENVTAHVKIDNGDTTHYPCTNVNGEWHASIPALAATITVEVWIDAWDWGMNRGESTHGILNIDSGEIATTTNGTTGPSDIWSSMYVYVAIAGGVAVVIIIVIVVIRKR
ncbi:MAG: hypothetical protein RTU63_03380 [Candidatus Thorarchaeota archaeon]